jgi:hypothetical protein
MVDINREDPDLSYVGVSEQTVLEKAWHDAGGRDGMSIAVASIRSSATRFPTLHDRAREIWRLATISQTFDQWWLTFLLAVETAADHAQAAPQVVHDALPHAVDPEISEIHSAEHPAEEHHE